MSKLYQGAGTHRKINFEKSVDDIQIRGFDIIKKTLQSTHRNYDKYTSIYRRHILAGNER